jgi:signal transduction histidine kinase
VSAADRAGAERCRFRTPLHGIFMAFEWCYDPTNFLRGRAGRTLRGTLMGLWRRSIRFRIFVLLLIPLLSLIGLYSVVVTMTVGDAARAARTPSLKDQFQAALGFIAPVQGERRLAGLYLATPTSQLTSQFDAAQAKTDHARAAMNDVLRSNATMGSASAVEKQAIATLLKDAAGLDTLRSQVSTSSISPEQAIARYSAVTADVQLFLTTLAPQASPAVQLQGYALVQTADSLELLQHEDAVLMSAAADASFSTGDRQTFAELVTMRRQLMNDAVQNMGPKTHAAYERYVNPQALRALESMEDTVVNEPGSRGRVPVDPTLWGKSVGALSQGLGATMQTGAADVTRQGSDAAHAAYLRLALAGGLGLLAVLVSGFVSFLVGRGLVRQLASLRRSALALATQRLPDVMARLRAGAEVDVAAESPPIEASPDEIGEVADAFNMVQRTAVQAAVDEARLRRGVSDVFRNLARRNQSLLHRQLGLLDSMERRISDPDELADLYRLDHLTTRMRRHAEGLIVLSGAATRRAWRKPVPLVDVLRAAVAEVEDYTRVTVTTRTHGALTGPAVADVIHLIAELVENATLYSPPSTPVRLTGDIVGNGLVVEIEDRGLGISDGELAEINRRLVSPPEFDLSDADRLGLFVAARLAVRHGVKISLRSNAYGGSTAIVLIPRELVVSNEDDTDDYPALSGATVMVPTGRHAGAGDPSLVGTAPQGTREDVSPDRGEVAGVRDRDKGIRTVNGTQRSPLIAGWSPNTGHAGHPDSGTPTSAYEPPAAEATVAATNVTEQGLPRRIRQANLAPQLREGPAHSGDNVDTVSAGQRSPDEARALMSAMQRGWQQGRSAPSGSAPSGSQLGAAPAPPVSHGGADGPPAEDEDPGRWTQRTGSEQ